MKKTLFRIELTEADSIFTDCVIMAATSNGGKTKSLKQIADHADWLCEKYETTGSTHTVNRIGEHNLTIDRGTKNILHITEITVMDLADETPTVHRYEGTGIDNGEAFENLN